MPLYDYKCKICGKQFEEFAIMEKRDEVKCECGGETEKLLGGINNGLDPFKPYLLENGVEFPTMITSRQQRDELFKEKHIDQITYRRGKYSPYSRIFPVSGTSSKGAGTQWTGDGLSY